MRGPALARAGSLLGALLLCLVAVGVRLGYVQVVRSDEYEAAARRQRVRRIELPAQRGAIYDGKGGELAISVPARTVYANPKQISDIDRTSRTLAALLGRSEEEITEKLRRDSGFVYLARRIGVMTGAKIAELKLPGVGVLDEARRLYPGGELASGVVGFVGTDRKGLAGLEYGYEELLGGEPGYRILEQDPLGRRIPQGAFTEDLPITGSDLVLTLDPDVQLAADRALARALETTHANGGMVVALDPRSGEILAMSNAPGFDPNALDDIDPEAIRNGVVTDAFEPGSVNKVITAAAALDEKAIGHDEQMWVPEKIKIGDKEFIEEDRPARSLDLRGILSQSSNLGTIRIAQKLGPDRLDTYFEKFGYGRGTGLGFPGESAGSLPTSGRWDTSLPTMAIGQGLSVTALQIAQVYATVANDGIVIEPRLVSGWVDPHGQHHAAPQSRHRRVVSVETARHLRDMLATVVSEGTGIHAAVPNYTVAGKTGTARRLLEGRGYSGHTATFFGMVPASRPEIVIGVVLDNPVPMEGGLAAAPVFSEIAKQAVRILHIPPPAPDPAEGDTQEPTGVLRS